MSWETSAIALRRAAPRAAGARRVRRGRCPGAGEPLRLLQFPEGEPSTAGDGAVSIQSTASLEAIGREAGVGLRSTVVGSGMTFTVSGAGESNDEDSWLRRPVRIGEAVAVPEGNIGRCATTTQGPRDRRTTLDTPQDALARYRGELVTTEPLPFGASTPAWSRRDACPVGDPVVVDPARLRPRLEAQAHRG